MNKGPGNATAAPGASVQIRTSGTFTVFLLESGKRTAILGPLNHNSRSLNTKLPWDSHMFYVKCEKSTEWSMTWKANPFPNTHPDTTPLEISIGDEKPLSIHEEMRRFIREEISHAAQQQGQESFEEEDDFDIPDPDEITSPYEMSEMQEEYLGEVTTLPAKTDPIVADDAKPKEAPEIIAETDGTEGASPTLDTPPS